MNDLIKLFLTLIALQIPSALHAEHLRFCYDPYPPYTLGTEGEATEGLKVKLLQAVVARIEGVTASVTLLPWKRCQVEAEAGNLDGILPLFPNTERASYLAFTEDTFAQESVFWYKNTRFPEGFIWSGDLNEFTGLTLGMLRGGYIDTEMEAFFEAQGRLTRASDLEALFLMLQHNRVDLIAIDYGVGAFFARQIEFEGSITRIERAISIRPSQFGLSRISGADKHLDAFNKAIQELHEEGLMEEIQNGNPYR